MVVALGALRALGVATWPTLLVRLSLRLPRQTTTKGCLLRRLGLARLLADWWPPPPRGPSTPTVPILAWGPRAPPLGALGGLRGKGLLANASEGGVAHEGFTPTNGVVWGVVASGTVPISHAKYLVATTDYSPLYWVQNDFILVALKYSRVWQLGQRLT